MLKNLEKILFSTRTMGMLLILYASSMAIATFVENDYGTSVAKVLIYNSWWFELIMLILIINFIGNIKRYQLYKRHKWPLLMFHSAFVILFIGGYINRYVSFAGSMHIREGSSSNQIISDDTFFKVQLGKNEQALAYPDIPVIFTSNHVPFFLKPFKKKFSNTYEYYGKRIKMTLVDFYARAQDSLIRETSGKSTLHLVVLEDGKRVNKYISSGNTQLIENVLISYNKKIAGAINITNYNGALLISSPYQVNYTIMATQQQGNIAPASQSQPFNLRNLYTIARLTFEVPEMPVNGNVIHYEGDKRIHENDPDLVKMEIITPNVTDTISFYGKKGLTNFQYLNVIDSLTISLAYGSTIYKTPFAIKLDKFKMDKYPGSNSPQAYSSDVRILDAEKEIPYKIFMNHILDHSGYRFFQSSFDEDEKDTILSVNHDAWGTNITYLGYTLLFFGMFVTLFWKGTHFSNLNKKIKAISKAKTFIILFLFLP